MAPVAEACEECTLNCQVMHKRDKNPSPSASATTFFKVMMGDDFSKILYLPPRFTRSVQKKAGKTTELENFNGEKWTVNFTKVNGFLAFQKGWDKFASAHGLKVGDLLVFHYVMESHFVVLMYGNSGCPERRHYQMETKENNTCDHFSHESSSQPKKRINEKETDANMPNTHHHLVESSRPGPLGSDKETGQRSDPLGNNTNPDKESCLVDTDNGNVNDDNICETPVTERQFCLVDNDNGNVEDERRKTSTIVKSVESNDGWKGYVEGGSGGGGGVETKSNEIRKVEKILGKQKENTVMHSEATCSVSSKKRSWDADVSATHIKMAKKEPEASGSKFHNATHAKIARREPDISGSRLHNGGCVSPSTRIFHKPEGTPAKIAKKEPDTSSSKLHNGGYPFTSTEISPKPIATPAKITKKEPVTSGSNLHNCGYLSTPTGNSPKPMAKRAEPMKKEPTTNYGSDGSNLKDTKMACVNSHTKESGNNLREVKVKSEPVDDDDAPPSSIINVSFSAVMSSYQYLELPADVKLRSVKSNSTVIFLKSDDHHCVKNGDHLWAVLYQTKLGLKALTQSWGMFARETGIQLGDKCVFVPENEPNVFTVHTTR